MFCFQVVVIDGDFNPMTCRSYNDPHLLTFDGLQYNNMQRGFYTLYKHKTLPYQVRGSLQLDLNARVQCPTVETILTYPLNMPYHSKPQTKNTLIHKYTRRQRK